MPALQTILLLLASNVFMTFAWYGHLRLQEAGVSSHWPLIAVIAFSWGIAFIEYCFAVPANRIGFIGNGGPFTLVQLKVIQEVISLTIFTVIIVILFIIVTGNNNSIIITCFCQIFKQNFTYHI